MRPMIHELLLIFCNAAIIYFVYCFYSQHVSTSFSGKGTDLATKLHKKPQIAVDCV